MRKFFYLIITVMAFLVPAMGADDYYYIIAADPQLWWKSEDNAAWARAISVVDKLKPDFLIVCGDLVSRNNDSSALNGKRDDKAAGAYKSVLEKLEGKVAVYNVAGNHDVCNVPSVSTVKWYEERFGKPWYSFVHKDSLFIVLESNMLRHSESVPELALEQVKWLEHLLKESEKKKYKHKTVYMHHPLFVGNIAEPYDYHNCPLEIRKKLLGLFQKYGVEIVFSGHLHANCFNKAGDVKLVSTASCCHSENSPAGLRLVRVTDHTVYDKYFSYGEMPDRLTEIRRKKK